MKRAKRNLSFAALDQASKEDLSSFGGNHYESSMNGSGPVKFPSSARTYSLEIKMVAGATNRKIILSPGLKYNRASYANGELRTAAVGSEFAAADGTAAQFAASGSPSDIESFLAWINQNPTRILGMKIKSTSATQLDQNLEVERQSPFRSQNAIENFTLSQYTDEYAQNDKIATIPFENQVDGQTKIQLTVVPGTTLNITFFLGDVYNSAAQFAGQ